MDYSTKYLRQTVKIKIDRPLGSKHPKRGFIYCLNYGYVPDTIAPDGEQIHAYLLGVFDPIDDFEGDCIAIIQRTNEDDDKLIIVPKGIHYSDEQIKALTEFQERFFQTVIIR